MHRDSLIARLAAALEDAEEIRARVDPTYQRHSQEELRSLVRSALEAGRDPGQLLTDVLGPQKPLELEFGQAKVTRW